MGFSDHLRESSQRVLSGSGDPPDLPEIRWDDHPLENPDVLTMEKMLTLEMMSCVNMFE